MNIKHAKNKLIPSPSSKLLLKICQLYWNEVHFLESQMLERIHLPDDTLSCYDILSHYFVYRPQLCFYSRGLRFEEIASLEWMNPLLWARRNRKKYLASFSVNNKTEILWQAVLCMEFAFIHKCLFTSKEWFFLYLHTKPTYFLLF